MCCTGLIGPLVCVRIIFLFVVCQPFGLLFWNQLSPQQSRIVWLSTINQQVEGLVRFLLKHRLEPQDNLLHKFEI